MCRRRETPQLLHQGKSSTMHSTVHVVHAPQHFVKEGVVERFVRMLRYLCACS